MKLIKITNGNYMTMNNIKWSIGKTTSIDHEKRNEKLCSDGVLHAYQSIEQALVMKSLHGYDTNDIKVFEVEGKVVVEDYDKVGCHELTIIKEIELPEWYRDEETRKKVMVRFACLCASQVLYIFEKKYPKEKRPRRAIEEAMKYGTDTYNDAATYAAYAAACAAYNAYNAYSGAAARAAYGGAAARAAYSGAAARATAYAACNAAYADYIDRKINVTKLMKKAIEESRIDI